MPNTPRKNRIFLETYIFWALLSLFNFDFLCPLALPFLILMYVQFLPFLFPPIIFSLICTGLITILGRRYLPLKIHRVLPLLANFVFLMALIPGANTYKNILINQQLTGHTPDCVDYGSFWRSSFYSDRNFFGNAIYEEKGKVYLWSYRERKFFEAQPDLARNFTCRK
ncbi:hypothetical protein [Undibacterium pigrum]|uniref:Uncharacterized protein n=1 Tax=Undibacterium pigrum TaxID=401470 RepID=A0A318JTV2_9BURK|nr:hypothetical protein [Undibacterium pigrum]PXX43908.1 hypothetical protein DFR42_103176 [Undibacterium pigrum]